MTTARKTRQHKCYRFAARAGASDAAKRACLNTGTAFGVMATTQRGARRILRQRLGSAIEAELFVCHICILTG